MHTLCIIHVLLFEFIIFCSLHLLEFRKGKNLFMCSFSVLEDWGERWKVMEGSRTGEVHRRGLGRIKEENKNRKHVHCQQAILQVENSKCQVKCPFTAARGVWRSERNTASNNRRW